MGFTEPYDLSTLLLASNYQSTIYKSIMLILHNSNQLSYRGFYKNFILLDVYLGI